MSFGSKKPDPLTTPTQGRRAPAAPGTTPAARTRPPDAPILGYAVPRSAKGPQEEEKIGGMPSLDAGGAKGAADAASEQMRKRAKRGSLNVHLPPGATSSNTQFRPRTLVGI